MTNNVSRLARKHATLQKLRQSQVYLRTAALHDVLTNSVQKLCGAGVFFDTFFLQAFLLSNLKLIKTTKLLHTYVQTSFCGLNIPFVRWNHSFPNFLLLPISFLV